MGAYGWGKDHSVIDWLLAEGHRFDFFQAVRLLEIFYSPEKSAQGERIELDEKKAIPRPAKSGATPLSVIPDSEKVEDFVRFKSAVGLSFPTSDISEVLQVVEIRMTARKFDFSPQLITVQKGQLVKLIVTSIDVEHGFAINKLKIRERVEAKQTKVIIFKPEQAGRFRFYCPLYCGDGHGDMTGELIVTDGTVPVASNANAISHTHGLEKLQAPAHVNAGEIPITEMTVNLMGLAGALGPLDMPTTELIIERAAKKDKALKDFLDIFNHRLISLLYRIRKMHRIGLEDEPPGQDQISKYLFSIIGLGTDGLMGRMLVRDRSLLHYAGLLSQQPRSLVGLELILSDYFKVQVKGHQFVGDWYELDECQWTKIGETLGQNHVLGQGAVVLGTRVWDQQAKVEIRLGPLTYQQFLSFIPTGWGYRALCDLTRFYLGDTLDVSFRLVLKGTEVPLPMLGMIDEPVLGWTSWLTVHHSHPDTAQPPRAMLSSALTEAEDDSQVVLHPGIPPSEFKSEKLPLFFNLPPAQLAELVSRMKVRTFTKFETIINQGGYGDSMFAIRRGRVRVTRRDENGEMIPLGILSAGECFGEMSLLLGKHREVTVVALEECEILELHKGQFDKFAARNPRWSKTLKAYRYGQLVERR